MSLRLLWSVAFLEGILLAAYALAVEPARLVLARVRVSDPRTDRPRRFLLLSDTHLRPWSHRTYHHIARAARWARARGATHVLLAGDLLEDDREADVIATRLRYTLGDMPALYVSGNHEDRGERWWGGGRANDRRRIAAAMEARAIERIDERLVALDGLPVLGIRWRGGRAGAGPIAASLLAAARGPALVVAHSPDHVVGLPPERVLLAVCGHTHGGQVRLPLIGAPWVPVRTDLPRLSGAMRLAGLSCYVSRGVGASIPVRLGAVPEAILLELTPSRAAATDATTIVEIPTPAA